MNLLVIIFIILAVWRAWRGLKNGFAKEVNGLVSLFMALVVLAAAFLLIASIIEKNTKTIIVSVVILVIISFLYRLVGMLMKSFETIAKLPVLNLINSILGAAAGLLEVLVVFWIMYTVVESFPASRLGEQIMTWTTQSTLLINIYNKNYIVDWIIGLKI